MAAGGLAACSRALRPAQLDCLPRRCRSAAAASDSQQQGLRSWRQPGRREADRRALGTGGRRGCPRGTLPVRAKASWAQSTAVGRQRSAEVIGVVIVDAGLRTPEGDELLHDFAAAYGHSYRRGIVAVANPHTLEMAVRDCVEEGADKVMVVPYLLSRRREVVNNNLPTALADVQLKLPGIRCIIGESISVESLLSQHIENQVKAVEVKAPAVAEERWWTPEPAQASGSKAASALGSAPAAGLPPAQQRSAASWRGDDHFSGQQAAWGSVGQHDNEEQGTWDVVDVETGEGEEAAQMQAAAAPVAPAAAAAPSTTVAWSDDFSAALNQGVLVVDYRQTHKAQPAAAAAAQPATSPSFSPSFSAPSTPSSFWGGDDRPTHRAAPSGREGPSYWYTDSSSNSSSSSGGGGSSSTSTTNDGSSSPARAPSFWDAPSQSSATGSSPAGSSFAGSSFGAADHASSLPYDEHEHEEEFEGYEEEGEPWLDVALETVGSGSPLESRLAHMEEQLERITSLLTRQRASRRQANVDADDAAGGSPADSAAYSRQQLEFLRRKEQDSGF